MPFQRKTRITLLLIIISTVSIFAQDGLSLSGKIIDAKTNETAIGVSVALQTLPDSSIVKALASDFDGKFVFNNVIAGAYNLKISFIGYQTIHKKIVVTTESLDLGDFFLKENTKILKEVKIEGTQTRVEQKEDTTQYNASAYKTNPDASVEDLVKKMPGITVENGTIKAQGEDVKKVLIDGQEFFGDDAVMAIRNLPAEVVEKLQVFDRQSDQAKFTGVDDGNQEKTINIITKPGMNNGQFGKVFVGYGSDDRYSAGGNLNFFKDKRRISVIGMSNNINQQNFSSQDIVGMVGAQRQNRGGGGRGGNQEDPSANFMSAQQNGITTTSSIGLNYSDNTSEKLKLTASYFFNNAQNENKSTLNREYFVEGQSGQIYTEDNNSGSNSFNHRFNGRAEYTIDTSNSLIFTPKFSWQESSSDAKFNGVNYFSTDSLLNSTSTANSSNGLGYNASANLLYRHKFNKQGRTISLNGGVDANNKQNDNLLQSQNIFYNLTDTTSSLDQLTNQVSNGYTLKSSLVYTEGIGKYGIVQANYSPSFYSAFSDKKNNALNASDDSYSLIDSTLSSVFDNTIVTQKGGLSYRYRANKVGFNFGADYQYLTLASSQTFPLDYSVQKNFNTFLPTAMFSYKFSKTSNLRVSYRTSANTPSITQLQSVINNTNPLLLSSGNPELKQQYANNFMARYGKTNPEKGRSIYFFANASLVSNYIGNSTTIATSDTLLNNTVLLRKGAQLSKPVNLDGYKNARLLLTYGVPLSFIKCNFNISAGLNYSLVPSLINQAVNEASNYTINSGLVVSSNISEKIDFSVSYTPNFSIVKNSIRPSLNNNYLIQQTAAKINLLPWKGLVLASEFNYYAYSGLESSFNQQVVLWNGAIGYKFLKAKAAELRFSVFDILNNNTSINRTVSDTYIEDSQTQVLNRYFLVTFTYNLKSFGSKETKANKDKASNKKQ